MTDRVCNINLADGSLGCTEQFLLRNAAQGMWLGGGSRGKEEQLWRCNALTPVHWTRDPAAQGSLWRWGGGGGCDPRLAISLRFPGEHFPMGIVRSQGLGE